MPERDSGWVTGTVDAEDARLATGIMAFPGAGPLQSRSGIRPTVGEPGRVIVQGTSPGKVTVQPFQAVIQGQGSTNGAYLASMDSPKIIDVLGNAPAHETLNRADRIVAIQTDTEYGDQKTALEVRHLVGTPSTGTPSPPAVPTAALVLADILVPPQLAALVQDTHVIDTRLFTTALGGILPVAGSSERPQNPYPGQSVFRLDKSYVETYGKDAETHSDGWAPITRGGIQWYQPDSSSWPQKKTITNNDTVVVNRVEIPAVGYSRALHITGHTMLIASSDADRFDISLAAGAKVLSNVVLAVSSKSNYLTGSPAAVCKQKAEETLTIDLRVRRSGSAGSATAGYPGEYTSLNVMAFPH